MMDCHDKSREELKNELEVVRKELDSLKGNFQEHISHLQQAEDSLRSSEEKYRSLIDSSDAAITMVDPEGNYLFLNAIASAPYGMAPEEMKGMKVHNLFSPELAEEVMSNIKEVLTTNSGMVVEAMANIAGEDKWFRTSVQPVRNESGKPYAALMYSTNITDSKVAEVLVSQSEQKYRALFQNSPDAYLIIRDGIIIECNKATEILANGDRSLIVGRGPEILSPDFQPDGRRSSDAAADRIKEAFEKGSISFEWMHRKLDGVDFLALVNAASIEYGGKPALFVTWKDITEIKRIQVELAISEYRHRQIA